MCVRAVNIKKHDMICVRLELTLWLPGAEYLLRNLYFLI
jgi:hypothetical protein